MAPDFGTDWKCSPSLDPHGETVSGVALVAQDLANRLRTPRGRLRRHPNYGTDIRALVGSKLDRVTLNAIRSQAANECRKDPRVTRVDVTVTAESSGRPGEQAVKIAIDGETAAGPFALVAKVSALSVEILFPTVQA